MSNYESMEGINKYEFKLEDLDFMVDFLMDIEDATDEFASRNPDYSIETRVELGEVKNVVIVEYLKK